MTADKYIYNQTDQEAKMTLLKNMIWNSKQIHLRAGIRVKFLLIIYIALASGLENLIGSITMQTEFNSNT
jgi:hypothetical protein